MVRDAWNERGLLSVCFDPEFSRNGWIYVYYTHNRKPGDKVRTNSNNRVSRFVLKGNTADANSEVVVLELNNLTKTGWHNGGGLNFGKDGKLYISTGENANGGNAQDGSNLLGKLLRINKDGSIPNDNPSYREFKDNKWRFVVGSALELLETQGDGAQVGAVGFPRERSQRRRIEPGGKKDADRHVGNHMVAHAIKKRSVQALMHFFSRN